MDCMQYSVGFGILRLLRSFNTASGMDCMQFAKEHSTLQQNEVFQYRKRYGLHAIAKFPRLRKPSALFQYRKRYGLHAIQTTNAGEGGIIRFNTASGMDCMQYRPSQPLGQLNPEAGFLNGALFWTNHRNPAGFFCRQNRLKTSANPVIPRKLLSTGKI